jgi:hypothetical protein
MSHLVPTLDTMPARTLALPPTTTDVRSTCSRCSPSPTSRSLPRRTPRLTSARCVAPHRPRTIIHARMPPPPEALLARTGRTTRSTTAMRSPRCSRCPSTALSAAFVVSPLAGTIRSVTPISRSKSAFVTHHRYDAQPPRQRFPIAGAAFVSSPRTTAFLRAALPPRSTPRRATHHAHPCRAISPPSTAASRRGFTPPHVRHDYIAQHHPHAQHSQRLLTTPAAAWLTLPLASSIVTALTPSCLTPAPIA